MGLKITIDHQITVRVIQGEESQIIKLLKELKIINLEHMAKTKQEFKDLAAQFKTSLDNVAADIVRLTEQLQRTDLTEAEEEEIYTEFKTLADQLKSIADQTAEPETPPSPEV